MRPTPQWFLPLLPTSHPTTPLRGKHRQGPPSLRGGGSLELTEKPLFAVPPVLVAQPPTPPNRPPLVYSTSSLLPPPLSPGAVPSLMCLNNYLQGENPGGEHKRPTPVIEGVGSQRRMGQDGPCTDRQTASGWAEQPPSPAAASVPLEPGSLPGAGSMGHRAEGDIQGSGPPWLRTEQDGARGVNPPPVMAPGCQKDAGSVAISPAWPGHQQNPARDAAEPLSITPAPDSVLVSADALCPGGGTLLSRPGLPHPTGITLCSLPPAQSMHALSWTETVQAWPCGTHPEDGLQSGPS